MSALLVALLLTQRPTLPPCTEANIGQCVDFTAIGGEGATCGQTPMGLGWIGSAPCPKPMTTLDAPLKDSTPDVPRPALVLKAGQPVPFDGVCMDDAMSVRTGKRLASCEAEDAARDGKTLVNTPLLVGGAVAVLALIAAAAGAGYVAGQNSRK